MIEFLYSTANAQTTSPALLESVDVTGLLGNVISSIGGNFDVLIYVAGAIIGVTLVFWLMRKVVALFPR